jgi:plastocyanin
MTSAAFAAASPSKFQLVIEQQMFHPATLTIPAGKQVKILVKNEDAMPAEFESYDFNREKVVPGKSQVAVYVGPLKAGTYGFFNDFHQSSKGKLIVKEH